MKQVLLDTHTLIWHLMQPKRVGKAAHLILKQVDEGKAIALIPSIVAVELSLLREAGRRVVGPVELQTLIESNPCFQVLPLDLKQATEFMLLGSLKDPFDRLIIAAARVLSAPLLSADERMTESGLAQIIWD